MRSVSGLHGRAGEGVLRDCISKYLPQWPLFIASYMFSLTAVFLCQPWLAKQQGLGFRGGAHDE